MSGKILLEPSYPVTQTVEAAIVLLKFLNRPFEPLPEVIDLSESLKLTLASKQDAYYVQYLDHGGHIWGCTCKAGSFNRPCRHVKPLYARRVSTISSKPMTDALIVHEDAKAARITQAKTKCEESRQQAKDYQKRMKAARGKQDQDQPVGSVRPTGKWAGGHNGPVSDLLEDMEKQGYEMSFEAED